uniref:Uncharacterized protein n=1 Tax=Glossina pallidipes TaxID=7398 RepID=A0A1A9ZLG9_GLOPL
MDLMLALRLIIARIPSYVLKDTMSQLEGPYDLDVRVVISRIIYTENRFQALDPDFIHWRFLLIYTHTWPYITRRKISLELQGPITSENVFGGLFNIPFFVVAEEYPMKFAEKHVRIYTVKRSPSSTSEQHVVSERKTHLFAATTAIDSYENNNKNNCDWFKINEIIIIKLLIKSLRIVRKQWLLAASLV